MQAVHLQGVDLNLLPSLHALLEERNVTRAGKRVNLSQPAMSRALERLRELLGDDLLIRGRGGYQLSARGSALLRELEVLLPRMEALVRGERFSPAAASGRIRLAMTDYAASVNLPALAVELARTAPGIRLEVSTWRERSYEDLSDGTVDLVFTPLAVPAEFRVERLHDETFACLVGQGHPHGQPAFSLKEYLRYPHISIETEPGQQNLVDRSVAEAGFRRRVPLRMPYIGPALPVLENSETVLTVPSRIAATLAGCARVRRVAAPPELPAFRYSIAWHPRLEQEALHAWLRELVRRRCGGWASAPAFPPFSAKTAARRR